MPWLDQYLMSDVSVPRRRRLDDPFLVHALDLETGQGRAQRSEGPGKYLPNLHGGTNMSAAARRYQRQVTHVSPRLDYVVRGGGTKADFDGYRNGTLLDAKYWQRNGQQVRAMKILDPRTAKASPPSPGTVQWAAGVAGRIYDEAKRQVQAAAGTPVSWHVSDAHGARLLQRMFGTMGLPIAVVHVPALPPSPPHPRKPGGRAWAGASRRPGTVRGSRGP